MVYTMRGDKMFHHDAFFCCARNSRSQVLHATTLAAFRSGRCFASLLNAPTGHRLSSCLDAACAEKLSGAEEKEFIVCECNCMAGRKTAWIGLRRQVGTDINKAGSIGVDFVMLKSSDVKSAEALT
jgi:hypothetical protein